MGLKIDMNKAYDRVEWDFLEALLLKFGFHISWVHLIMNCLSTVSFSVLLNGKPGASFFPSRGLRQGDPLSPYLFILVGEVLTAMINKACLDQSLTEIRMGAEGPWISHLLFADDSLFFLQASLVNCQSMMRILTAYCTASGQMVNFGKSSLFFSPNTPLELQMSISAILGIQGSDDPSKYLGLPTMWGRSKKQALAYVKDKVSQKIQGWKQLHLTQAGREVMVKSVISAIPAYPMAVFLFTDGLCRKIDSLIANFWWGQSDVGGKVHWLSWEKLGLPKEEGGMGFRCLKDFNMALLAKIGWRILRHPDAMWVQVLKGLYFPNCDFLSATKGSRASWAWSSILEGRKLLQSHVMWQVLNGESISTWKDRWIPGILSGKLGASHLVAHENDPYQRVADLIDWSTTSWNLDPIAHHLSHEEIVAIESIPLSSTWEPDKLIWPFERHGAYTVRSGYHLQHQVR